MSNDLKIGDKIYGVMGYRTCYNKASCYVITGITEKSFVLKHERDNDNARESLYGKEAVFNYLRTGSFLDKEGWANLRSKEITKEIKELNDKVSLLVKERKSL